MAASLSDESVQRRQALLSSLIFLVLSFTAFKPLGMPWGWLFLPALAAPLVLSMLLPARRTRHLRAVIIFGLSAFFLFFSLTVQMVSRSQSAPNRFIHDGAVQTEDAVLALQRGENPYTLDYEKTNFGAFIDMFSDGARPNPAWTHYVYLPFPVAVGVPLGSALQAATGWFDIRLLYLIAEIIACIFLLRMTSGEWRLVIGALFLLNPFWTSYFVFGFNDIAPFAAVAGMLWNLSKRRWTAAGIWYGLAVASKQHAWLFAPFLLVYLWREHRRQPIPWKRTVVAAALTAAVFLLPFFLWNPSAFIDDIYRYPTGSTSLSYPASGIGLSSHLVGWGMMRSMYDYYPFIIFQALIAGPLLGGLLLWLRRHGTLPRLIAAHILFAFVFWYLSRYFNTNYLSYLSFFAIAALALQGPPAWIVGRRTHVSPAEQAA